MTSVKITCWVCDVTIREAVYDRLTDALRETPPTTIDGRELCSECYRSMREHLQLRASSMRLQKKGGTSK